MKIRQRLTSIWSLGRRSEVTVRIHYRVRQPQVRTAASSGARTTPTSGSLSKIGCQIYELTRVEEMEL
jgi:hypothetical protein